MLLRMRRAFWGAIKKPRRFKGNSKGAFSASQRSKELKTKNWSAMMG
jgi:hypothetical protein